MRRALVLAAAVCAVLWSAACAQKERYGTVDAGAPSVQVKDLLLSEAHAGRDVRVTGKIAMQCASSGCWFFLDDGTGRLLVDLKRLGLGLPQRAGKQATVSGTVVVDQHGQVLLDAKGLEVS